MGKKDPDQELMVQTLFAVPHWIDSVTKYKDASILRQDFFEKESAIRQAMEATDIEQLDLSLIGKVYKVIDEWLFQDRPLRPLDDNVLSQYSED